MCCFILCYATAQREPVPLDIYIYIYVYTHVYIHNISLCIHIYIYIYVYMGDVLSPPLLFDHPAIYKTSWQRIVGHHFSNFSKTKLKKTRWNKNNSKTISNNINTGYPALDPTANQYLSGSGWEISVFVCLCFCFCVSVFLRVVLFLYVFVRL